ncbi:DNA (cytosine-5-)-methyltransferase [Ferruginibacter profundus]
MTNEFARLLEATGLNCKEASEKLGVAERTIYRWSKGDTSPKPVVINHLKDLVLNANNIHRMPAADSFNYIDLFAGIGGFRKAFDAINGNCVFTSEWDKASRLTYQANYVSSPEHIFAGDIREYTKDPESLDRIPAHDLLVAGFPCQPFSLAGVSKKNSIGKAHGFKCDTQGTLFFDVAQILDHHRPAAFLLENVKNLLSHDEKRTFKVIHDVLTKELKYNVSFRIIDGKSWVPQHRERIFIVGFKEDLGFNLNNLVLPGTALGPKLGSILHKKNGLEEEELPYTENGKVADKYTLSERLWDFLKSYKEKHALKGNGFGFGLFGPDDVARTLSARYYKDGSEILIEQKGKRPRRLTPRECARIMGFDLPNESNFKIPVSDTQAYRQFGNSVIVPAAKTVAEYMKPYIMEAIRIQNSNQLAIPFQQANRNFKKAI